MSLINNYYHPGGRRDRRVPPIVYVDKDEYDDDDNDDDVTKKPTTVLVKDNESGDIITSRIIPLSESPTIRGDPFTEAVPREVLSIASLPVPESTLGGLGSSVMTEEEKRREEMGMYNYREFEWVGSGSNSSSLNIYNSRDANDAIVRQKARVDARRLYERYYLQQK